jgi:pimeloyl-ACP methyl ester carboxylesterase
VAKALINGIKVHYQVKGSGPDVILIHGITSSLAQWYIEILPALARDYRVTVYDLRGHGLSEMTESGYDSQSMARDLLGLMDHLGIEKACFAGHSYGGVIALHLALLRPERVRGIVLMDTGLACLRYLRAIRDWVGWERWGNQLAHFGITMEWFLDLDRQQDAAEIIRRSLSVPLQSGFRKGQNALTPRLERLLNETKMGSEFREVGDLTEENLARIQAPVLALYGGTSPYAGMAGRLNQLLPHCRVEMLAEAGHFSAAEDPGLTLDRMSGFLRDPDASVSEAKSTFTAGGHAA